MGGDETCRGAGGIQQLRSATPNPRRQEPWVASQRAQMTTRLHFILSGIQPPAFFPFVLIDCRSCKRVHAIYDKGCAASRSSTAPDPFRP